jgi:hypothetical protein
MINVHAAENGLPRACLLPHQRALEIGFWPGCGRLDLARVWSAGGSRPHRANRTNDPMLKKAWLDLARQFHEVADRLERHGS